VGSIQALEAIRLLAGIGSALLDRVLRIDARDLSFELREVARRKDCPSCAGAESKLQAAL
jgi:molybdopterin/thiamine biosynthesis adenylyltransferase